MTFNPRRAAGGRPACFRQKFDFEAGHQAFVEHPDDSSVWQTARHLIDLMIPGQLAPTKIIRLLAAAGLLRWPAERRGRSPDSSCVPCLVIGIEGTRLKAPGELRPGRWRGRGLSRRGADSDTTLQALEH